MIGTGTLVELVIYFVGTPQNDIEQTICYFGATMIFVLLMFVVIYIIKVISLIPYKD